MVKFKYRVNTFLSSCWAFIASLAFSSGAVGRALCVLRRAAEYVVRATANLANPVKAEWKIIERMCSDIIRVKFNVFGRHPRNTGALSSPLL